jgi:hypothetical protein
LQYGAEFLTTTQSYTAVSVPLTLATNYDSKGVRAFVIASGSLLTAATNAKLLPQFTTVTNNTASFIFSGAVSTANVPLAGTNTLFYNRQPTDNTRGDFEDNSGAGYPNADSTSADAISYSTDQHQHEI